MSLFTDAEIQSAIDSEAVHIVDLFKVDFASGTKYYSTEVVGFTDNSGTPWEACGDIVNWSDFGLPRSGVGAQRRTYTLPLVDEVVADLSFNTPVSEYRGRTISHLLQFFTNDAKPIGLPIHLVSHLMDQLKSEWVPSTGSGPGRANLIMNCEGVFAVRNSSPFGYMTAADQKSLFPTDNGLNRQHLSASGVVVTWPDY